MKNSNLQRILIGTLLVAYSFLAQASHGRGEHEPRHRPATGFDKQIDDCETSDYPSVCAGFVLLNEFFRDAEVPVELNKRMNNCKNSDYYSLCAMKIIGTLALQNGNRRPPPRSGSLGQCILTDTGSNRYSYFKYGSDFNDSDMAMVCEGSKFEILSYEDVYYNGKANKGVKLKVISHPSTSTCGDSSRDPYIDAPVGTILWEYNVSVKCK